ncbi:unnamed protein product [Amoebophrya sp. A25]|nr:unnamed protein product [Amoebophrya sp. A25]|eukprot:GSA25T00015739001.1
MHESQLKLMAAVRLILQQELQQNGSSLEGKREGGSHVIPVRHVDVECRNWKKEWKDYLYFQQCEHDDRHDIVAQLLAWGNIHVGNRPADIIEDYYHIVWEPNKYVREYTDTSVSIRILDPVPSTWSGILNLEEPANNSNLRFGFYIAEAGC